VEYEGTNSTHTYQKLSKGLIKYPPKFNNSTLHDWGIKKMRCHEGKRPKCHAAIRELPALPPLLHHSMILKIKRRRRAPLFNQPQNKNNPKKHCLPRTLFNVLAERKCSRWLFLKFVILFYVFLFHFQLFFSLLSVALLVCIKRMPTEKEVERDIDGAEVGGDDGFL
jgi:hypothetical protein